MIEIEHVTGLEHERQAHDIRRFVKAEKAWLAQARPDTLKRHRTLRRSIAALALSTADENLSVYIVRRDHAVVGLGTIISSLTVRHPLEDEVWTGREIDYWAGRNVTEREHIEIATELMGLDDYEGIAIGLLTEAETERAQGVPATMEAVGKRSWIEVPGLYDRYGIAQIPDLQLYVAQVVGPDAI